MLSYPTAELIIPFANEIVLFVRVCIPEFVVTVESISIVIVLLSPHSLGSYKMLTHGPVGSVKGY